jgi:hypothetical protein
VRPTRIDLYEVRFADPEKVTQAAWNGRVWRHDVLPPTCERSEFYWREIGNAAAALAKDTP